jgi:hypothetical protein
MTLPTELADELRARHEGAHRVFGSLRVTATLGSSRWRTSLFTDTRAGPYLLPIKAEVRRREHIEDGDTATITLDLDD